MQLGQFFLVSFPSQVEHTQMCPHGTRIVLILFVEHIIHCSFSPFAITGFWILLIGFFLLTSGGLQSEHKLKLHNEQFQFPFITSLVLLQKLHKNVEIPFEVLLKKKYMVLWTT